MHWMLLYAPVFALLIWVLLVSSVAVGLMLIAVAVALHVSEVWMRRRRGGR